MVNIGLVNEGIGMYFIVHVAIYQTVQLILTELEAVVTESDFVGFWWCVYVITHPSMWSISILFSVTVPSNHV